VILKDRSQFRTRYLTVFRESGVNLMASVNRRLLFTAPGRDTVAFALDYETHSELTTPIGKVLDGSTGLNGPRTQHLAVLYLIRSGRICKMWMSPDAAGVAKNPQVSVDTITKSDEYCGFAAVVKEILGVAVPKAIYTTRFVCACHELKGRRPTMEDKTVICTVPDGAGVNAQFVGVYDGHGGQYAAEFVADTLHMNLQEGKPWKRGDAKAALHEAFLKTDEELLEKEDPSGTCALVALLHESTLHVAHVGDCRAVLCSGDNWEATRLTEDHKPDRADERSGIVAAGGDVVLVGCWRVTSSDLSVMMATSRALGDRAFKTGPHEDAPLISPVPEIMTRTLTPNDHFLITACDGVWDVMSDQEACDVVHECLKVNKHTPADTLARGLVEASYNKGSNDNISVAISVIRS